MHRHWPAPLTLLLLLLLSNGPLEAAPAVQQAQQPEQKPEEKPAAAAPLSPAARLAAAKTAYLHKTGNGDNAAYDVVSTTLDGWGRFTMVNSPEKADIVIEIYSHAESEGGVGASVGSSGRRGREGKVRQASVAEIKLTVYDPKTKVPLWAGVEHPKSSMKKTDRENKEVEATERLMQKFHDTLEPPGK